MTTFATTSGLTAYNEDIRTAQVLTLLGNFDVWNESSAGSLILDPSGWVPGRRATTRQMGRISGLIQRRDPTSTADIAPSTLADSSHGRVQLYRAAVVDYSDQDFIDLRLNEGAGRMTIAENWTEDTMVDYLQAAVSALLGAIQSFSGNAGISDVSTTDTLTYPVLNTALGLLGDARNTGVSIIMRGYSMTNLIGTAYSDANIAFNLGSDTSNVAIYGGMAQTLGLRPIVSDLNELFIDNTGTDHYWHLVLRPNAVTIMPGAINTLFAPVVGGTAGTPQTFVTRWASNSEFMLGIRGVSYTGVGNNPDNAALANPASWTPVRDDVRSGPGIIIKTQ